MTDSIDVPANSAKAVNKNIFEPYDDQQAREFRRVTFYGGFALVVLLFGFSLFWLLDGGRWIIKGEYDNGLFIAPLVALLAAASALAVTLFRAAFGTKRSKAETSEPPSNAVR
ncbi:MAG: hypothetical protein ACM31L_06020 [Actinomycetota bacterium]